MTGGRLIAAAFVSAVALSAAARAEPSPQGQDALQKGLIAAQQQDYPRAIGYFREALRAAPSDPEVLGDLGLAESKIPGHELRAIAWFGAYLSARPTAPNVDSVKALITQLDLKAQGSRDRLIKLVWDAADAIPGIEHDYEVPALWVEAGETTAAMDLVDRISAPDRKVSALIGIANAQVRSGDRAGARQTLLLAQKTPHAQESNVAVLESVAQAQLNAGDIAGASSSAALVTDPAYRFYAFWDIANGQADAGDITGAKATIATVLGGVHVIQDKPPVLRLVLTRIAAVQVKIGDRVGAKRTLSAALVAVSREPKEPQDSELKEIADGLAQAGDIEGALGTARRIGQPFYRDLAFSGIARFQADQQDVAGAERTEAMIQDASQKDPPSQLETIAQVARNRTPQGPRAVETPPAPRPPRLDDWLRMLDDTSPYGDAALNTDPFLDLSGALEKLRATTAPGAMFGALYNTASKVIVAQNTIRAMLARQAGAPGQR